jgi:hypothetical protein
VVAGIDEPCALHAKNAIILAVEFEIEKVAVWWPVVVAMGVGWRRGGENEAEALPVGGTAKEVTVGVVNLVDVAGKRVKCSRVEDEAVVCVFGVLHCAEEGVGVAADEDVEGVKVGVALVAEGEEDDEDGGQEFDGEDGRDESGGDGTGIESELHWDAVIRGSSLGV